MKSFIEKFKSFIRFIVTIFASREFGFLYCLIGTFAQVAHTYFLTESISSFQGGFRIFQAVLLSVFISSSLLYFVAIADNTEGKEGKRIHWAINIFAFIEIVINFYYYSRHLIIDSAQMQVFDFVFAILVSCLIPVTIKLYGGLIKAREWMGDIIDNKLGKPDIKLGKPDDKLDSKPDSITEQIIEESTKIDIPTIEDSKKFKTTKSQEELVVEPAYDNHPDIDENNKSEITELKEEYIQQQIELAVNKRIEEFKSQIKEEQISDDSINTLIDKKFESIRDLLTEQILEKFDSKQEIFLKQFTNKCKAIIKNLNDSGDQ